MKKRPSARVPAYESRAAAALSPPSPHRPPTTECRAFTLDRADAKIDEELRTVELSFSSETAVERWWGNEILDHSAGAVDLSRMNNGGAVLVHHDARDQVAVCTRAWLDATARKCKATVKFSRSVRGQEIFQDVVDGIRRNISCSYEIGDLLLESETDGKETYRVRQWTPLEISFEPVPADPAVGVGRGQPSATPQPNPTDMLRRNIPHVLRDKAPADGGGTSAPALAPAPAGKPEITAEDRDRIGSAERSRIGDIVRLGQRHKVPQEEIQKFIDDGNRVEDFQKHILETRYKAAPVRLDPNVGMSDPEVKRWSLVRACQMAAAGKPLDGIEAEASAAVAKRLRRDPQGFFIPHDVADRSLANVHGLNPVERAILSRGISEMRALTATVAPAGGFSVSTDVLGSSMIELLRNKALVTALGARTLGGLMGDVAIPRHTGGATAYWLDEATAATLSQQTFGQLALIPHRLAAVTAYSKQLLAQSSIDVEAFVREDLMRILAVERDRAVLDGTGGAGQPVGILQTTGIGSVTFGAAATWAKVLDFETQVAAANADLGALAYLTTPATRAKWKAILKVAAVSGWLWGDDGRVNGYRAEATLQVPTNRVIFGNWSDMILADWDGMDVVIDPYSLSTYHQVQIVVNLLVDHGVRHVGSFAASTDSGAQ